MLQDTDQVIYILNNKKENLSYNNAAFLICRGIAEFNHEMLEKYLHGLNLFTAQEFWRLHERIFDESNTMMNLTVKETVMLYAAVDVSCKYLLADEEEKKILELLGDEDHDFGGIRFAMMKKGEQKISEMEKELTDNRDFKIAFGKIREAAL